MQSIFIFAAALPFVAVALAQFPTPNFSPSNLTLRLRQACICNVINSGGCTACTEFCCPIGYKCGGFSSQTNDMCCNAANCVVAPPPPTPPTSTSTSSTSTSSTSTSSMSTSSTSTSSTSTSSTSTSSTSTSTSSASTLSSSPAHHVDSRIIGSAVGGSVAGVVVIVVVAVVGTLVIAKPAEIKYLWGLLVSALFGVFIFESRRLVFTVDKDVPPTQISLFLTPNKQISDSTSDGNSMILVWKVFHIGYTKREFVVGVPVEEDQKIDLTIPSTYGEGVPEIGFGTVIDDDQGQLVTCDTFGPAPATLNEERVWTSDSEAHGRKRTATIRNPETSRIAVGTIDGTRIHPFLLVERAAFKKGNNGDEYPAEGDLYLHAFRSINYAAGRYGSDLVSAIEGDNLCLQGGIKIKSLRPLTSWRIRSAGGGKLKLEICKNRKEDVNQYKHEIVIKRDAQNS